MHMLDYLALGLVHSKHYRRAPYYIRTEKDTKDDERGHVEGQRGELVTESWGIAMVGTFPQADKVLTPGQWPAASADVRRWTGKPSRSSFRSWTHKSHHGGHKHCCRRWTSFWTTSQGTVEGKSRSRSRHRGHIAGEA